MLETSMYISTSVHLHHCRRELESEENPRKARGRHKVIDTRRARASFREISAFPLGYVTELEVPIQENTARQSQAGEMLCRSRPRLGSFRCSRCSPVSSTREISEHPDFDTSPVTDHCWYLAVQLRPLLKGLSYSKPQDHRHKSSLNPSNTQPADKNGSERPK